jgi:hypothetical protein
MREQDMRDRVQNFLRATMRNVVMPASMGLGLALAGCGGSDDPVAKYMAPMFDAAVDVPVQVDGPVAKYMGPMLDGGLDGAGGLDSASIDPTPLYMAIQPDAGAVTKYMGPMPSDAGPAPMYMAIQPDAAAKETGPGPVMRYMAIQPDAAQIPIYAAPVPPAKV